MRETLVFQGRTYLRQSGAWYSATTFLRVTSPLAVRLNEASDWAPDRVGRNRAELNREWRELQKPEVTEASRRDVYSRMRRVPGDWFRF